MSALKMFRRGLLLGGMVGTAVGILFAPKKGSKTRNEMREAYTKLEAQVERTKQEVIDTIVKYQTREQIIPVAKKTPAKRKVVKKKSASS